MPSCPLGQKAIPINRDTTNLASCTTGLPEVSGALGTIRSKVHDGPTCGGLPADRAIPAEGPRPGMGGTLVRRFYAVSMQVLCSQYAGLMQSVCRSYAPVMQVLCSCYAGLMQEKGGSPMRACIETFASGQRQKQGSMCLADRTGQDCSAVGQQWFSMSTMRALELGESAAPGKLLFGRSRPRATIVRRRRASTEG